MRRAAIIIVFFAVLVGVWWLATASGRWSAVMLPSPLYIGEYLWNGLWDGSILEATPVTMQRLLVGYFIGVAIGLPLGLLMSAYQWIDDTIGSIALGFQTLPSVCWVPLALIWFGQSETAMLFVVVMGTVSGHDGETEIRRRVVWTWKLRDNRAVMVRVADLGAS